MQLGVIPSTRAVSWRTKVTLVRQKMIGRYAAQ